MTGSRIASFRIGRYVTLLQCVVLTVHPLVATTMAQDPWNRLENKTAWTSLGTIDVNDNWATVVEHRVLPSGEGKKDFRIPERDDLIELTAPLPLLIVDFRTSGEENRLMSPAGRALSKNDLTGITVPIGSRLRVHVVSVGPAINGLRDVWVLVGPGTDSSPHSGQ